MLQKLSIRHFAIIESLDLEFQTGLNILSGETGAGKSIILQAMGLILGARAYTDLIRTGEDECEVRACFLISKNEEKEDLLKKWSLSHTLEIRRLIQRNGKGKVWIQDKPATVGDLQEIGPLLVDLVSQHESHHLREEQMPLLTLDEWGGHHTLLSSYQNAFQHYQKLHHEVFNLENESREAKEKEDLFRFQLKEIQESNLSIEEEERLLQDRKILTHSSKIIETLQSVEGLLYSANDSVMELLGRSESLLLKIQGIDPDIDQHQALLHTQTIEVEECARFFQSYLQKIDFDPARLNQLEERLDLIHRLKKKYGGSVAAVLQKEDEIEQKLRLVDHFDETLEALKKQLENSEAALIQKAQQLSEARKKSAKRLAAEMEKQLSVLAMGKTIFEVRVRERLREEGHDLKYFTSHGIDEVGFYISPNRGEEPKPLHLIASGGELSRILLALKSISRDAGESKIFIFDEVDTGISGAVAEVVGQKLKKISEDSQVLCITHLPQIAAFADAHYQIFKSEKKQRVVTQVSLLSEAEREEEVARMLAGVQVTQRARENARELIQNSKIKN